MNEFWFNRIIDLLAISALVYYGVKYKPFKVSDQKMRSELKLATKIVGYQKGWFEYVEKILITGAIGFVAFNTNNFFAYLLFFASLFVLFFPVLAGVKLHLWSYYDRTIKNKSLLKKTLMMILFFISVIAISFAVGNFIKDLRSFI